MNDHLRDETLMAQVVRGRQDALEPLVQRYARVLLNFIDRMVGNQHRSEELFQEVFLAVWLKRRSYEFPRPFRNWLYAIAMNKCRESYREGGGFGIIALHGADGVATRERSPSDQAIAGETAQIIAQAVAELPLQQRTAVVLRIWQDLSFAEIADVLGTTEGTARSHMHHGLCALRGLLERRLG